MKPFCSRTRVVRTLHSENKLIMSQVGANNSGERVLFYEVSAFSLGPVLSTRSSAGNTCDATLSKKTRVCPYRGGCRNCKRSKTGS